MLVNMYPRSHNGLNCFPKFTHSYFSDSRLQNPVRFVSVAHFLESRGMTEDALEVATDPDYRFELAIQLGRLEIAKVISYVMLNCLDITLLYSFWK